MNRMFPVININNKSQKELGNLIFTYDECKYPGGVRSIRGNSKKEVKIPNKHLEANAELLMIYRDKKGNKRKYIIERDFGREANWELNLNVYDVSEHGELEFNIEKIN